ncbi:MAG: U32 family peptidase, partial [Oscillospiraceae bacterium]
MTQPQENFNELKLEVLSPVGDFESLEAAVKFGADAVYLGSTMFTMRVAPENFGDEKLKQAVDYAHENSVKVYLTCNTLPRGEELAGIYNFFENAKNAGVDA